MPSQIVSLQQVREMPDSLRDMFAEYPFRRFYRKLHGIRPTALADFHTARALDTLGREGVEGFGVVDGDDVAAVVAFVAKPLTERACGIPHFDAELLYNFRGDADVTQIVRGGIAASVARRGSAYWTVHLDAHDVENVAMAQQAGFRYIASNHRLVFPGGRDAAPSEPLHSDSVRVVTPADVPELVQMLDVHHHNQFFYDRALPDGAGAAIFRQWLPWYLARREVSALGLTDGSGHLIGFTCWECPEQFNRICGVDVVVNEFTAIKQRGLGRVRANALLLGMMNRVGSGAVETRVMSDNYESLRLCWEHGAVTASTDVWLSQRT